MKAFVTAFESFGGDELNPALEALRLLPPRLGALSLVTQVLPTAFDAALDALYDAIATDDPDFVLGIGLAGGRPALSLERVAINIDDARIADNMGQRPVDRPVVAGGPAAYFTNLPIKAMVAGLRDAGLPAIVSNTAGTFVCNHLFYGLMHFIATRRPQMRGVFLHVPYLPSQAARHDGAPSMALADIARGIETVLAVAAARQDDIAAAEGAIS